MARYSIVRAWACVLQFEQAVRRNVQTEPWFYYVLFAVGDFLEFERHLGRLGTLTTPVAMLECHVCLQMCWILTYWIILGSGLSLLIKPPTFIVMKMLEWKQQMSVLQYCHCEIVEYLGIPEVELVEGQRRWKKMRKTANMFARAWNLLADSSIPWNDFARLNLNEASLVYFNIFNTVLASAPGPFVGNCRWGGTGRTMSPY